jgi:hypothetical protein
MEEAMYRSQQNTVETARRHDDDMRTAPVHGLVYAGMFSLMIWAAIGAVILLR